MGGALGTEGSRLRQEELERMLNELPDDINLDKEILFTSSWIFTVIGALVAIPVGIKRKSYGPLVFYGTTGTMLDIIVSVQNHERKRQEWLRNYFKIHGKSAVLPEKTDFPDLSFATAEDSDTIETWTDKKKK